MSWLKFTTIQFVLFATTFCFAAEPAPARRTSAPPAGSAEPNVSNTDVPQSEHAKARALREVAQNWIQVGVEQSKRGLYEQAEESFLNADSYQEHLTTVELKELEGYLAKAHQANIERRAALEQIKTAGDLRDKGRFVKAMANYEQAKGNPYLTEQERKQLDQAIKSTGESLDKQKKEVAKLYNRSVELFKADELEKAREGFVEVAKYDVFVAPVGQSAEDYLLKIDGILTGKIKNSSPAKPVSLLTTQVATPAPQEQKAPAASSSSVHDAGEIELLKMNSGQGEESSPETKPVQGEANEAVGTAESTSEEPAGAQVVPAKKEQASTSATARERIICTYTKAVVEDAAVKVGYYIGHGEFDNAVSVVRTATGVIEDNRVIIGEELFAQYSIRLKQLTEKIIRSNK
ncbi:MAG: hypothetical protein WAK60_01825 [Sedimentisphaerales bacterium]